MIYTWYIMKRYMKLKYSNNIYNAKVKSKY